MTNDKDDQLTKAYKDLDKTSKSLSSKMKDLKSKIEKFSRYKDKIILCDVSGSMGSFVDNGSKRAIDVVNHVLESFAGANIWEFSSSNRIMKVTKLSYPNGSTAMHSAFDVMKGQNYKEFILITDGHPDSENDALKSAKGLKINIIYIGPKPVPPFLKRLANVTNGAFVDVALMTLSAEESAKELEAKITLMLNP